MSEDAPERVRYAEPGSTWWPVLWVPAFCLVGVGLEAATGPVHWFAWAVVGVVLTAMSAFWVRARRQVCAVQLTDRTLRQGNQNLPVARIVRVRDDDPPMGARVLGGGLAVPRKTSAVPLELDDGSAVVAWARHPDILRAALRALVDPDGTGVKEEQ